MGFFSWKNSDTGKSIINRYHPRGPVKTYMLSPTEDPIEEDNYEGYGVFGGKDAFNHWMDLNKPEHRDLSAKAKRQLFFDKYYEEFRDGGKYPLKFTSKKMKYSEAKPSENADDQGYFL